jgi:hypothetical protein
LQKEREGLGRRGSVLEEAHALELRIGSEDRGSLDQYFSSVREVEIRTERADHWLDVPCPKIAEKIASTSPASFHKPRSAITTARCMIAWCSRF